MRRRLGLALIALLATLHPMPPATASGAAGSALAFSTFFGGSEDDAVRKGADARPASAAEVRRRLPDREVTATIICAPRRRGAVTHHHHGHGHEHFTCCGQVWHGREDYERHRKSKPNHT